MRKILKAKEITGAVGLCAGRHDMPVSEYVFGTVYDVFAFDDMHRAAAEFVYGHCDVKEIVGDDGLLHPVGMKPLDVIVTGLSALTAELVATCAALRTDLTLWHYDRETGEYMGQRFPFSRCLW